MTVDLHRILCGVAARCFHEQQQHFIDPLSPLFDISIMNGMAFRLMKILLFAGWRHKNCLSSLQCLRSTNADHTDSSRACRCRNRCDRIFHSSPPKYRQLLPLKILFDIQQNPLDHSQKNSTRNQNRRSAFYAIHLFAVKRKGADILHTRTCRRFLMLLHSVCCSSSFYYCHNSASLYEA